MNAESKKYYDSLVESLDEIEANDELIGTLSATLKNDSEKTDYDKWLKGSVAFAKDNPNLTGFRGNN